MFANINALVVNKRDKAMCDVGKGSDVEVENVVMNGYHHDRENDTLLKSTTGQVSERVAALR